MKDNSLDGHRGKVALSDTTRNTSAPQSSISSASTIVKCDLKTSPSTTGTANDGSAATNFDDDYNEWELGIGDLIIDLDADIEKTNGGGPQQGIPTSHHSHHHGHHHHHHHHHHSSSHHQNGTASSVNPGSGVESSPNASGSAPATTFNFLGSSQPSSSSNLAAAMSNSKSPRITGNSGSGSGASSVSGAGTTGGGANSSGSGTFEHQATVDKGLKMKIKRKTVGNKYSEAKHEIVQSDTKSATSSSQSSSENSSNSSNNCSSNASGSNSPAASSETPKSKHSSSKGRTSSHREKKEKNRDKDKSSSARNNASSSNSASVSTASAEVNGVLSVMSPLKITNSGVSLSSPAPPPLSSNSSPLPSNASVASPSMSRSVANSPAGVAPQDSAAIQQATGPAPLIGQQVPPQGTTSSSPPMPNLTLKLESKFTPSPLPAVVIKQEDRPCSPPLKKIKMEPVERNGEMDCPCSPESPEMKDTSTCTSVGTITEPDCLGPCEPGTSVMLEGIVWQETEGGVLVVNVTWRGKTYVGTLLDCTKHDWAPPRFCESPTSDVDSKTSKGRGKRGRGGNNSSSDINTFADARNCVQSKLRNGKGRRTTINSNASTSGFTVPNSPAKSENGGTNSKRKGRPADLEISTPPVDSKTSKRSRTQNRSTPTSSAPAEFPQPSSPVLIVCPEPNCSKKYKHINGLRYHQTHAHSASDSSKMDDTTTEDSKDVTNSSDNEESMQESASVSTSPAPSFTNSVPSHPTAGKIMLNETALSSSSNMNSLPKSDLFNLTTDLSTLASVAISDSKSEQKSSRPAPVPLLSAVPQEMPVVNSDGDDTVPPSGLPVSDPSPTATSVSSPTLPVVSLSPPDGTGLSTPVSAVTTSVIQSSSSVDSTPISQAVTVSIPASHVIFNQGLSNSNNATTCYTASSVVCNNSNPLSPSRSSLPPSNVTSTFASISSISSTSATSPSALSTIDKTKIKQERPDKYKPKSPVATSAIRPIVPAPASLHTLPGNLPGSHSSMGLNNHGVIGSPLKPIQPKPTTLGEPTMVNPSLEGLKKEKSKHKKKSKDRDRDKKLPPLPLTPTKLSMNANEECEAMELTSYPSLETVSESSLPISGAGHAALSSALVAAKPPDSAMDMVLPDDSINENVQSPAYSDISDANDTAPVLESEVPAGKEKEDKVGKTTPDASQSPAANISAYGMYPYYSQPPYLIPSVSPQSAVSGSQGQNVVEKSELSKKNEQERVKESRPWSNPSGESRERPHMEHHESEKKPREENVQNPNAIPSPATPGGPVQDYPIQQHYPYPYGYVQGYPYPIEPSSYHMHMLESDPHYKQQYKQYIEEQQRLYKEQQHHHQQQQLQQHLHHHQQQQQSQHHGHQSHHSQHQSHHQSKSHHGAVKEERDRSRDSKDKSGGLEKMSNSGLIVEHSSKIQHSSMSLVSNKEHEVREIDSRPPSLPAQARLESSNSASAAALKEKQNENHQILKENIELKSQMDDNKNKMNQYAMLFEMQREDMRRYYMYQDRVIEQQQQKMEPGIHHHTHHHQTIQPHGHLQAPSASYSSSSSLKSHKEDHSSSIPSHSKSSHYGENPRSSTISPAKSDHVKNPHSNSTSSPKGSIRDSALSSSKDYMSSASSRENTSSKKDSQSKSSERSESSGREDKKGDKIKVEPKVESEGQKPTMETTGPPPPPTNSYAYLHPSYLQPTPTHFPHMPFEPAHAMYRGGINPMLVSSPHYGGSPYVHPQIRYVTPGACELPAHSQPPESLGSKMHPSGPPKALDLLHQVSQHYTTTHKIHELQEHAMMSPTPTSTPSSTPSTVSSSSSGKSSSTEPAVAVAKMDVGGSRDSSRSPPTQRHLHTHHHTHVGVTYPMYDPYGGIVAPGPPPPVDCKPIHPMQVKSPAASARYWQ